VAIEQWIDDLAKVWEFKDSKGQMVKSARLFTKTDFPDTISVFPQAISYPTRLLSEYSVISAPQDIWQGRTEFHLTPNLDKSQFPYILKFFAKIRNAAAGKITLGGKVMEFHLRQEESSIEGPVQLQYGEEAPHYGLLVYWQVIEFVDGDFTIGG
jgi:hypothetical protein